MTNWMLRGLVFAAAMVVVRVFQGALIDAFQTQAGLISIVLVILFIAGAVAWGVIDGRADAAANPDPDRRSDLAMTWLLAGLVAGVVSGAVTWLISTFDKQMYVGGLINELTTFAAFTALLVFLAGIAGVTVGRFLIDRTGAYAPREGDGGGEDRVDTDVFAAVRSDEAAEDGTRAEEQRTQVATAQREDYSTPAYSEEPTEATAPAYSEETTAEAPAARDAESTEEIPTEGKTKRFRRSAKRDEDQR